MPWQAELDLHYNMEAGRCVARHTHTGPLRILQSLYPEGDDICHNILVHPPGGLLGGDTLDININVRGGAHGLITTPGATRFYRSDGELARQRTNITMDAVARLEWLPLEALCYSGCLAENQLRFNLAPGAELIGWDITALGLPAAEKPFKSGSFCQHIEAPGVWLERARLAAGDNLLMDSPLGLGGHRCIATLFFIAGTRLEKVRRQAALDIGRSLIDVHPFLKTSGVTSPDAQVVLVRVLAPVVEPAMALLREVWLAWRSHFWGLGSSTPRIWST